ncbi:hypothetical protein Hamer_G022083 [Homarus americanus]|uniref:Uncharacterized protein n=1 Tax=Homarus americanus TaxID=6706 RepID=A0A8J5MQD4_HOMAM|nr:hypothetical protein Hamer_G022083 [Homarus americanus]
MKAYSPTENHNRPATTRARRSVTTVSPEVVSYDTVVNMKFKVKGGSADYLQVTTCFRVHRFDVLNPYPEGGQVVVFESHDGNRFIQGASSGDLVITRPRRQPPQDQTPPRRTVPVSHPQQGVTGQPHRGLLRPYVLRGVPVYPLTLKPRMPSPQV